MKPVKSYDITVKFTKTIIAFNEIDTKAAMRLKLDAIGVETYEVLEVKDVTKEPKESTPTIGSGSINDQYEFNKL